MKKLKRKINVQTFRDIAVWLSRTSLVEVLFLTTLILSKYLVNIDFSYPGEVILPIVLSAVLGSAVFYAYRFIFGRVTTGHLASLPLLYTLYYFTNFRSMTDEFVRSVLPKSLETDFTMSIVLVIALALVFGAIGFILTKVCDWHPFRGYQLPKVILFLVAFLFVWQSVRVGATIVGFWSELHYNYKSTLNLKQDQSKITAKPDVYYLVFDRYANAKTLQDVYGYDNSKLLDYLDQQGFVTREEAQSNYPFTMSSISSTLAMDYHTQLKQFGEDKLQTAFPYRSVFEQPPVADYFRNNGYTYNQVSSWWDFSRVHIDADQNLTQAFRFDIFGKHIYLSDLTRDILNTSVFGPLLRKGVTVGSTHLVKYDLTLNPQQNFEWQMSALKSVASSDHAKPQFTFAHVLSPHDPYIFDANGKTPSYDNGRNDNGADELVKYTNQLTYLNTRIQDVVGYIRAHDPQAAVIIQADEGPYPKEFRFPLSPDHFYNPKDLPVPQMKQKFGILASYYMPSVDKSTVAQNISASVNPFRFVLKQYLGYDVDMLPNCQFATGDKFKVFEYTLMNQTLSGQAAPAACNTY